MYYSKGTNQRKGASWWPDPAHFRWGVPGPPWYRPAAPPRSPRGTGGTPCTAQPGYSQSSTCLSAWSRVTLGSPRASGKTDSGCTCTLKQIHTGLVIIPVIKFNTSSQLHIHVGYGTRHQIQKHHGKPIQIPKFAYLFGVRNNWIQSLWLLWNFDLVVVVICFPEDKWTNSIFTCQKKHMRWNEYAQHC